MTNTTALKNEPVVPVTCLTCQEMVWYWPGGLDSQGRPLTFDLIREHGQPGGLWLVHSCHFDDDTALEDLPL